MTALSFLPLVRTSLALALVSSLAACGGAASSEARSPEKAASDRDEPEPATIEEAQARIARAREALGSTGAPSASGGMPSTAMKPGAYGQSADSSRPSTATAPPPPAEAPASTSETSTGARKASRAESQCTSPCRALGSMRRAVAALCRLTGDTDGRCTEAKRTLADSEGRITPCSC